MVQKITAQHFDFRRISATVIESGFLDNLSGIYGGFIMANAANYQLADRDLVAFAQTGDTQAMDDLITVLRPAVFKYCRFRLGAYGGGLDAADDAAQETCLAVFDVLSTFSEQGPPFRAWVYAIAAHKVVDAQRRYGRSAVLVEDFPDQIEPSPTPEDRAVSADTARAVMALVERLPNPMRTVLQLRAGGASAKSVGEDLGMSAAAVNVAHHRAKAKLRRLAQDSEEHRELFALCL